MKTTIITLSESSDFEDCVLVYGHFNTIHPGHLRFLRYAKEQGEKLAIALVGDDAFEQSPKFSQSERGETLALLGIADAILCLKDSELPQAVKVMKQNTKTIKTRGPHGTRH